ncbi:MAG TPA: hypothetical protein ENK43_16865 [Planctomycetes bacterium]|nr:hypothetical protein [Planctomycetota bacterium]
MKTPRSIYAGTFLIAGSIILFEIALTRVFAIMMWHHFTYMVVSIALLGFGAAGSILTATREADKKGDPTGSIAMLASVFGLAVMLSLGFATKVNIDTLRITEDKSNLIALLLFYLIIGAPMLIGGLVIGKLLTRMAADVNRIYFADLVGSAVGGAASVYLLQRFGAAPTVIAAGFAGCLSGLFFSCAAQWRHRLATSFLSAVGAVALIGILGGSPVLHIPEMKWRIPDAPGKELYDLANGRVETRIPSATAEVEVTPPFDAHPMIGGNFSPLNRQKVEARFVAQDGTAPTMLYGDASNIAKFPFLPDTQAGSAYVCFKARGAESPDVLVIGVGGGVDVMVALANDARHVTAVEINQAMIRMVTEFYADFSGGLFIPGAHPLSDRIQLENAEGRAWIRHGDAKYDIIQMSGVDSFTALSTGAYTLSETYLYTVEAVKDFYAHLNDGGYVNYSRFILDRPKKPRETLRLANIAREALAELGVEDAASSIAVFQGIDWASTIIKKGPFTRDEIQALKHFAERLAFRGLVFDPLKKPGEDFDPPSDQLSGVRTYFSKALEKTVPTEAIEEAGGMEPLLDLLGRAYNLQFQGRTAESSALVNTLHGNDAHKRRLMGLISGAVSWVRGNNEHFLQTRRDFEALLRSDDAGRAKFIDDYEYNLTPCTDDRPFFFNYYKWRTLLEGGSDQGESTALQNRYHPDFPVGHTILLISLAQILLMAGILIFWPIRHLAHEGIRTKGSLRYFSFFAALGLGFMFLEIALMQMLVVFLGHPTYSLSVVLSSLLAFAGLGSFLAGKIRHMGRSQLSLLLLGIVATIGLTVAAIHGVLPHLLAWPFPARVAVVVALLCPLGLALGTAFPSGIRILNRNCPQLIPWGWAINGFLSVMASILCIVLSQEMGFTRVIWIAAGLYVVGFALMKPEAKGDGGAKGAPADTAAQ